MLCGGPGASARGTFSPDRPPADLDTSTPRVSDVAPVPAPERDGVSAVRTATGFVLPVIGGEPGAWVVRTPCAAEATVDAEPIDGAHVVLDPGHGGSETGAIGPSGMVEEA